MTRFIKVVSWDSDKYGFNCRQPGNIRYLNIDSIEIFYQLDTSQQYNFDNYYDYYDNNNSRRINPIRIITKKEKTYYSPMSLQEITKLNIEEIDNRFDILDL